MASSTYVVVARNKQLTAARTGVRQPQQDPMTLGQVRQRQLNDRWTIEGLIANRPYPGEKENPSLFDEKNPFDYKENQREYMAWYHKHHPGYFARKNKEWLDRKSRKDRLALFAQKNRKNRIYITASTKLRKRIRGIAHSRPTFSAQETDVIRKYPRLADMYRKVMSEYPA